MPIVFSVTDRLAITRRQVKIAIENEALQTASDSFNGQETALLQVDNSNKVVFDFYNGICVNYQLENEYMTGNISPQFTNADVANAGETATGNPFFPTTPTPYSRSIPLIQDGSLNNYTVKGFFHPSGVNPVNEQLIMSNTTDKTGITELSDFLSSGFSGTGSATTTTPLSGGPVTNVTLMTTVTTGFAAGNLVYISNSSLGIGGIYIVTNVNPSVSITVSSIIPATSSFSGSTNINRTLPAFSVTERQSLVGSSTDRTHLLNNIVALINSNVTNWKTLLDNIVTATNSNEDDRTPYNTQNATASTTATTDKNTLLSWEALPPTGITGRYTSGSMSILLNLITNRTAYIGTRVSQITNALGGSSSQALSQSGDTYSTTVPNNPYHNRYKWLNFRINRATGSLRRYYSALQSKNTVNGFKQANLDLQGEYDSYFLTKPIIFNDGSDIVHVKDTTGFSVGDNVIVVSETQPELNRTIVGILGTTQLKLNALVPKTYTIDDLARVFKVL